MTGAVGLHSAEAARRLAEHGPNELAREEGPSRLALLARQFRGPAMALLAVAGAVSLALGEAADAAAIAAIVGLNALVGFVQEHRAERALVALRAMSAPESRVVRDGVAMAIPSSAVVPGDLLLLEAGDVVGADALLREAHGLFTVESLLTGESAPVAKDTAPSDPGAPLAERHDHVYLGTAVAAGRGVAEVAATGMRTEMGRIAALLVPGPEPETPLQQQLARVGGMLVRICLAVVAVVCVLGLLRGQPWMEVLLSSVALAVASVPEGLPAMVTIALALGVRRMAARRAIVRRLASVETLGCATVICADKTGTLTTGRMEVRDVWSDDPNDLLRAAASCCDAQLGDGTTADVGDPTELALLRAAAEYGHHRAAIERATPRRSETPFDSQRRRMSVLRADGVLYVKGAVESVLPLCATDAREAMAVNQDMADRGLRVLAVALGPGPEESGLRLLGLVGIADPPRPEAKSAVARARDAGIRTVMITGDHPVTAHAVAAELGLVAAQGSPALYARVTPEEKIRIVRELKGRGEIVAMTGDGVNDAPAIREAHIGIAMGRGGTTVTREASDMVLTDDNFATIVAAVEEGRAVYDNIRKALVYLLTGNASELLLMLAASLLALPLPLLPVHLLWINLVTDGLPALALVMDPPSPGVLSRPPRRTEEPMLGRPEWKSIAWVAGLEVLVVLAVFARALGEGDLARARALAFSTLVFCELFRALASRSRRLLYWQSGVLTNLPLGAVIAVSAFLQLGAAIVPAAAAFFDVRPISLAEAAACVAAGLVPVSVMELRKLSRRVAA